MTERKRVLWTKRRIMRLKKLWKEDIFSVEQIGVELDFSKNAVSGKLEELGLLSRKSIQHPKKPNKVLSMPARTTGRTSPRTLRELRPQAPRKELKPPPEMATRAPNRNGPAPSEKCLWPFGDPKSKNFCFCDEDAVDGKPYCKNHYDLAHPSKDGSNPLAEAQREADRKLWTEHRA